MVGHATGLSSDESRNFMSSILLNPMVKTAGKCVEEYSAFALSQCTRLGHSKRTMEATRSNEWYKLLKNIKNGQNILVLVGLCFFRSWFFYL
jgi:hypothetical protein